MNDNQIADFYAFCDERELARPEEILLRERRWTWVLAYRWTCLSIDRWAIFGELSQFMSREEYADTLRWLWSHSEGDLEPVGVDMIFTSHNGVALTASAFLTPQATQVYNSWPATITIYRGCTAGTRNGLSWTEHHSIATAFARMRAPESPTGAGLVLTAECNKSDILCYILNDLNEYEILIPPGHVTIVNEEPVHPCPNIGAHPTP